MHLQFTEKWRLLLGAVIALCVLGPGAAGAAPLKIYLAGPLGFSEEGRDFKDRVLVPELLGLGYQVFDPWKLTEQRKIDHAVGLPYGAAKRDAWRALNPEIGQNNQDAIDQSDAVLAILDGTDVDSGTAAEIGYAYARGKPIIGYRGDFRLTADNEGAVVNLQVEHFIRASGGSIVSSVAELPSALTALKNRQYAKVKRRAVAQVGVFGALSTPTSPALLDVISFFERVFGIVLALALGEGFKQSVSGQKGGVVQWERLLALSSFLLLIFPFFQGMNRYFFLTYGNLQSMPHPYPRYLLFDGAAFMFESAIFFVMTRVLAPGKWRSFYLAVLALLCLDTVWAAIAYFGHGSSVVPWLGLNLASAVVLMAILWIFWRRSPFLASAVCLAAMVIRTIIDYWSMWGFYFPTA